MFFCFIEAFSSLDWSANAWVLNHVINMAIRDGFGFYFLWKPLVPRRVSSRNCCNEHRIDLSVQPLLIGDWQWVRFAQNVGLTPRWMGHIRLCCISKQSQRIEFSTEDQCFSLFQAHGTSPYLEYKYNKLPHRPPRTEECQGKTEKGEEGHEGKRLLPPQYARTFSSSFTIKETRAQRGLIPLLR